MGWIESFSDYMLSMKGTYGNWFNLIKECTDDIFLMSRDSVRPEMIKLSPRNITPGNFYLLRYNFNGNLIWCPVLTLEYKVIKNKNIMFAINLEYIPIRFKIFFFDKIFRAYRELFGRNQTQTMKAQVQIPIKFDLVYKLLKDAKKEYVITAYDMSKIVTLHWVSTNLSPHFVMINTHKYNSKSMKDYYLKAEDLKEKLKIGEILEEYEIILKEYDLDSDEFHKKLKSFEKNFKLFENEQ